LQLLPQQKILFTYKNRTNYANVAMQHKKEITNQTTIERSKESSMEKEINGMDI
jgi:hypothetical protein